MSQAHVFSTAARKAARAWRMKSTWFVSKIPAVRQTPATNKGVLLGKRVYILSPLLKKTNWKAPNLAGLPWDLERDCASACFRIRLIVPWPIPVWLKRRMGEKRRKEKGRNVQREQESCVFVLSCHWVMGGLNREYTQGERMCFLSIKGALKEATRWVAGWREGTWQPHHMSRCWDVLHSQNFTSQVTTASLCKGSLIKNHSSHISHNNDAEGWKRPRTSHHESCPVLS